MLTVNYRTVRANFKEYCDKANNEAETIIVARKDGGNVVILSEKSYNNMLENLFIRSSKSNYLKLIESVQQLKQCEVPKKILIDD